MWAGSGGWEGIGWRDDVGMEGETSPVCSSSPGRRSGVAVDGLREAGPLKRGEGGGNTDRPLILGQDAGLESSSRSASQGPTKNTTHVGLRRALIAPINDAAPPASTHHTPATPLQRRLRIAGQRGSAKTTQGPVWTMIMGLAKAQGQFVGSSRSQKSESSYPSPSSCVIVHRTTRARANREAMKRGREEGGEVGEPLLRWAEVRWASLSGRAQADSGTPANPAPTSTHMYVCVQGQCAPLPLVTAPDRRVTKGGR